MMELQREQQLILQNLNSSIITLKDGSIKYFNQAGKAILDTAVLNMGVPLDVSDCNKELIQLNNDIQNFKHTKISDKSPECTQQRILGEDLFTAIMKEGK